MQSIIFLHVRIILGDDSESSSDDASMCESKEDEDTSDPEIIAVHISGSDESDGCDEVEGNSSPGLLQWILIIFFKIQFKYYLTKCAASAILSFIFLIFRFIGHPLSGVFPKNVDNAMCAMKCQSSISKTMYVVCPKEKCNALYVIGEHPLTCTKASFHKVCGARLGYEHCLSHGKVKWIPYKKFQFIKPSSWLQHMYQSSEFLDLIELWKTKPDSNLMEDVYDGKLWNDMNSHGLFTDNNIGLMLNVDWFKPLKHSEHKVAAIMLTVLNLPREERFKKRWTIVAGIS